MNARTPQRQQIYDFPWTIPYTSSALRVTGIRAERIERAYRLLDRFGIPSEKLPGALLLVFRLDERDAPLDRKELERGAECSWESIPFGAGQRQLV